MSGRTAEAQLERAFTISLQRRLDQISQSQFCKYFGPTGLTIVTVGVVLAASFSSSTSASRISKVESFDAQASDKDFSKFVHTDPNHARLPCLLCHRRENNSAQPTLPGKSGHVPCIGCHAPLFQNSAGPICTICHTNAQTGTVKTFPRLETFNARFDHARHASQGAACGTCHRQIRGGVALSIPTKLSAHNTCYSCHSPRAQANGRDISSCGICHQPGPPVQVSDHAAAFRTGFSHANHDASENLKCADCHKVLAGQARGRQVTAPVALNHHAPARVPSCKSCHNGQRTFGGDDFSACKRCHKGSTWYF